jgi:hypothetical protein
MNAIYLIRAEEAGQVNRDDYLLTSFRSTSIIQEIMVLREFSVVKGKSLSFTGIPKDLEIVVKYGVE